MSRLLHEPTIRLRSLEDERGGAGGHASLELVRELFGLREDAAAEQQGAEAQSEQAGGLAEVHDLSGAARRPPGASRCAPR